MGAPGAGGSGTGGPSFFGFAVPLHLRHLPVDGVGRARIPSGADGDPPLNRRSSTGVDLAGASEMSRRPDSDRNDRTLSLGSVRLSAPAEPCSQEAEDIVHVKVPVLVELGSGLAREPRGQEVKDVLDAQPAAAVKIREADVQVCRG